MSIVTAYDTLGEEGLKHSMLQTKAKIMFTDPHLLPKLVKPFNDAKDIQVVIYSTKDKAELKHVEALTTAHPHLKVMSFDDLVSLGKEHPADPIPPKADDLACIMYTSGSTGTPKGVLIKHSNVVAASESNLNPFQIFADGMQLLVLMSLSASTSALATPSLLTSPLPTFSSSSSKTHVSTGEAPWATAQSGPSRIPR